jgi:hypothetical protein
VSVLWDIVVTDQFEAWLDALFVSDHNSRPGSAGRSEVRILFCFDPRRQAVLLLGGDKSGNWNRWYDKAIPEADRLYEEHLAAL